MRKSSPHRPPPRPQKAAWSFCGLRAGEPTLKPETPPFTRLSFTQNTAFTGSNLREPLRVLEEAATKQGRNQGHAHSPTPATADGALLRTPDSGSLGPESRGTVPEKAGIEELHRPGVARPPRSPGRRVRAAAQSKKPQVRGCAQGVLGLPSQLPGSHDAAAPAARERAPGRLRAS